MFRRIDDDRSKQLSYEEFRKGIHDTGLVMEEEGYREMFTLFDKDGSGQVSIDEFLYSVRVSCQFKQFFSASYKDTIVVILIIWTPVDEYYVF